MARSAILIVDDDPLVCASLAELLQMEGYEVQTAPDGESAVQRLSGASFEVILADVSMPGISGFDLLRHVRERGGDTDLILITAYGTVQDAVAAIKNGAYNYVAKPLVDEEIKMMVRRCIDTRRIKAENRDLRQQLNRRLKFQNLIGNDPRMQRIYQLIEAVADTRASVLLTGESGTGKTLIARVIHYNSPRASRPFIEVSCGALPDTLLESELFGHVRGSFTGAVNDKPGKFELADGGTIFLDEISAASPALQVKLLRVLQERRFERVGGSQTFSVDVRVIIATNTDLATLMKQGRFREDLYYRVNVVSIDMPRLRERPGDIPLLANHFLRQACERIGRDVKGFDKAAMEVLIHHSWPGNVREVENAVERSVVFSRSEYITPADLPPQLLDGRAAGNLTDHIVPLRVAIEGPERSIIENTLKTNNWNRQKTASVLGINRTTLFNKMRKYNLLQPSAE